MALFFAIKLHDKFDPARYFLLLWGGQILLIYAIFHNMFTFTGYGLVFISITCITFSIGTLTGHFIGNRIQWKGIESNFNSKRALLFLLICLLLSLIYVFKGIYANGFNIKQIIFSNLLLELNNTASVNRYSNVASNDILTQMLLVFIYVTPLYGGYLLPLVKEKTKLLCYISILPPLLITLTQSIKAVFIASVALWGVGILVSSYANNSTFFRIRISTVLKIVLFSISFFSILFISMIFRTGQFDWATIQVISENFSIYAFGHLPAFDSWFSKNIGNIDPTYGVKTFYGISNFIGIAKREQGVFADYVFYAKDNYQQIPPDMGTNVYTIFRFILEDFGFIGSFLIIFFSGLISGFSYIFIKKQNGNLIFQVLLISILFFISWSFVSSVWAYTSFIAAIFMMFVLLKMSFSKIKSS